MEFEIRQMEEQRHDGLTYERVRKNLTRLPTERDDNVTKATKALTKYLLEDEDECRAFAVELSEAMHEKRFRMCVVMAEKVYKHPFDPLCLKDIQDFCDYVSNRSKFSVL